MNTQLMWILIVAAAVAIAVAFYVVKKRRTARLRHRFGPEYDRAVRTTGDVGKAEARLEARARRVERLHITSLSADDARRFREEWRLLQAQFVDDPKGAVVQADRLIGEVMRARGYP